MQTKDKVAAPDCEVTDTLHFQYNLHVITVEISNTDKAFAFRMKVGDEQGDWTTYYPGLYRVGDFVLATEYWSGTLEEFVPYHIEAARRFYPK